MVQQLQTRVVKRTTMKKQLRFFFSQCFLQCSDRNEWIVILASAMKHLHSFLLCSILFFFDSYVYLGVEMEAVDALPVVHVVGCKMFATGGHLQSPRPGGLAGGFRHGCSLGAARRRRRRVSSFLQSPHELDGIWASNDGVLTRGFLHTAPSRIAHDVDNWRPVREPRHALVVECASFSGHHLRALNSKLWTLINLQLQI